MDVNHFGNFTTQILKSGWGGGYTAIPHALDVYERCLGLSVKETWLLKRLCRHLPSVFPSFAGIAKESGVSNAELGRIKKGLIAKGFIVDKGAVATAEGRMSHELDIMPLFTAVFICILCDSKSKIVKDESMADVRALFSCSLTGSEAESYVNREGLLKNTTLPLTIEQARGLAEQRGVTLNWIAINELQNGAAMAELQESKEFKLRMLQVKEAINIGRGSEFSITYKFGSSFNWLKWLCNTTLLAGEITDITEHYCHTDGKHTAKKYMEYVNHVVNHNAEILNNRQDEQALVYAEFVTEYA